MFTSYIAHWKCSYFWPRMEKRHIVHIAHIFYCSIHWQWIYWNAVIPLTIDCHFRWIFHWFSEHFSRIWTSQKITAGEMQFPRSFLVPEHFIFLLFFDFDFNSPQSTCHCTSQSIQRISSRDQLILCVGTEKWILFIFQTQQLAHEEGAHWISLCRTRKIVSNIETHWLCHAQNGTKSTKTWENRLHVCVCLGERERDTQKIQQGSEKQVMVDNVLCVHPVRMY